MLFYEALRLWKLRASFFAKAWLNMKSEPCRCAQFGGLAILHQCEQQQLPELVWPLHSFSAPRLWQSCRGIRFDREDLTSSNRCQGLPQRPSEDDQDHGRGCIDWYDLICQFLETSQEHCIQPCIQSVVLCLWSIEMYPHSRIIWTSIWAPLALTRRLRFEQEME